MMGALDWLSRKLIVTTSRSKRSTDFMTLLQTLDFLYGPKPGMRIKPVVIVLDNGPIHTSKATLGRTCRPQALAHRRVVAQIRARTQRYRTRLA